MSNNHNSTDASEPIEKPAPAIPAATAATIAWVVDRDLCEPETVLPLPEGTLLVSNVCNFRETGNGYLSLLSIDGDVLDARVVDKLDAPLGMAINDGVLHVVDANRVRKFRLPDFAPMGIVTLSTKVANDVAVARDGTMYVTDTAKGHVVQIDTDGSQRVTPGSEDFAGANGIALDGDDLFVGGARLWRLNLSTQASSVIGPPWLADIDGIELESDGTMQITPVGGPLVRYRDDTEFQVLGGEGVSSTNHGYAPASGLVLIPTGFDGTVVAIQLPIWPWR